MRTLTADSEFDGFEVFQPTPKGLLMTIELKVQGAIVQLTYGSVKTLHYSQYVNFYLDRKKQRVMVKPAEEKTPHALKIKNVDVKGKQADLGVIPLAELAKAIRQLAGIDTEGAVYFGGSEAAKQTLIFDLKNIRFIERKKGKDGRGTEEEV